MISAIDGMAGIGKTALAIHAAHRMARLFPDGQLFVDLHGYTKGMSPREPADALAAILHALGVAPGRIPADLEARAALYRDHLSGSRTLIVLDNAATEAQVRPLLPGSGRCLVLVTSRKRLRALDDARPLSLDLLAMQDAIALFREVAQLDESRPDDPALREIAELCGRLPLALRIAAALLRHRPSWTLWYLAHRLQDSQVGLADFSDSDRDLAALFDLSYHTLDLNQQELFRLLGVAPGPEIDRYAAAALLRTDPPQAERLLEDLVDHNLLIETAPGRYRMHDLIRLHARALVEHEPLDRRISCSNALLDYYQYTGQWALMRTSRYGHSAPKPPTSMHAPALLDKAQAFTWLRVERANLLACLEVAAARADYAHVVGLTPSLVAVVDEDGPWFQAIDLSGAAVEAAQHLGDAADEADALARFGQAHGRVGDPLRALRYLARAVRIYRGLGDHPDYRAALIMLGHALCTADRYHGADRILTLALEACREFGDLLGQANALSALGRVRILTGEFLAAIEALDSAINLYSRLGRNSGENYALSLLGKARQETGDYQRAMQDLELALELYRDHDGRLGQAQVFAPMGTLLHKAGDYSRAEHCLLLARNIYLDLGDRGGGLVDTSIRLGTLWKSAADPAAAARYYKEALEYCRDYGRHHGEARALNHYAALLRQTGDIPRARELHARALDLARKLGKSQEKAHAFEGLGLCCIDSEELADAARHLGVAADIFERLGMRPDAERVRARLAALGDS